MKLEDLLEIAEDCKKDACLCEFTTFKLGGPCPCIITCTDVDQLEKVISYLRNQVVSFLLLGSGSNVVVSDLGVDCPVIRFVSQKPIISEENDLIEVVASTQVDDFALYAAQQAWQGFTCLSGIPGTLGGAIVGNAGAFGKSISDYLISVKILNKNGELCELKTEQLNFSYRDSALKKSKDIILSAIFRKGVGDTNVLMGEREEILKLRKEKHPDYYTLPTAGSFFKNIEAKSPSQPRQAAGWFLEQSGAKMLSCGGASVFERHANIIVKPTEASAQDVYDLSIQMARSVKEKFGIDLIREVRFLGMFDNGKVGCNTFW